MLVALPHIGEGSPTTCRTVIAAFGWASMAYSSACSLISEPSIGTRTREIMRDLRRRVE
jgi:hypothetical protein